ncbi:iron-sulfur cluster carrier protein MrpORP [Anaerovorax odorimutans]|uniref:iron-sulfur cluster carrier protein MrpORP n=1 Tax=Anaerovorax odorimutans TaxID=109327 RepID=UPI00040EA8E7|nr:iron-sulfur cluster carrier protein MrpORP [Anaerovorax odorimutans]
MSENCSNNCNTCNEDCSERKQNPESLLEKPHYLSEVKKVIGIVSGKGGVGKSSVTSMLAVSMNRKNHKTAILDADVTGPSIPKAFGLKKKSEASEMGIFPVKSTTGIDIMSVNLILENDTDPVVWRGPVISGVVKQFWTDVIWGNVDYMFIDMPPGTGDVPLTVFQSIPIDGIIIVTSPQELVSMIVSKAVKMAEMMKVPVIGVIENMSYLECPDCHKEIKIFGESNIQKIAHEYNIDVLAKLPLNPNIAKACDDGTIEEFEGGDLLDKTISILENMENNKKDNIKEENGGIKMKIAVASEGKMVTEHFGHCESFIIFETENDQIVNKESVANPGHKPGFLPNFLNDMGVKVIISGGMGGGAIDIFNEKGIEVITGASGDAEAVVNEYLKGNLKSTGSVCHDHMHSDECGNH